MTGGEDDEQARDRACAALTQLDTLLKLAIEKLVHEFVGAHQALILQQSLSREPACAALARQACAHLDGALTALQFEDIASQLIASAQQHWLASRHAPAACMAPGITQQHMESGEIELF